LPIIVILFVTKNIVNIKKLIKMIGYQKIMIFTVALNPYKTAAIYIKLHGSKQ